MELCWLAGWRCRLPSKRNVACSQTAMPRRPESGPRPAAPPIMRVCVWALAAGVFCMKLRYGSSQTLLLLLLLAG